MQFEIMVKFVENIYVVFVDACMQACLKFDCTPIEI